MRLTTKGRYAVTAMVDLALHAKSGPVCLADIAKRQEISLSYLEQLFAKLRRKSLVKSIRGPGGGYLLAKSEELLTVAEIIDAVDETIDATNCSGQANCHEGGMCLTHHLWANLSLKIHEFLSEISVATLIKQTQRNGNIDSISAELINMSECQ